MKIRILVDTVSDAFVRVGNVVAVAELQKMLSVEPRFTSEQPLKTVAEI